MAYLNLEDLTGQIECLAFPRVYRTFQPLLKADQPVILSGRLSAREDEEPRLIVESAEPLVKKEETQVSNKPAKLYLRLHQNQRAETELLLARYHGSIPVYLNDPDISKTFRAPESLWISRSKELIDKLEFLLGAENVRLVE